jgi:monoamine oxidase
MTNFAGGSFSSSLQAEPNTPAVVQAQADRFLKDLNKVFPGARAAASKVGGQYVVAQGRWATNPLAKGSYTCPLTGHFSRIEGLQGLRQGNVFFAGEHADSFYNYQGFMEGALTSGHQAAKDIVDAIRDGQI